MARIFAGLVQVRDEESLSLRTVMVSNKCNDKLLVLAVPVPLLSEINVRVSMGTAVLWLYCTRRHILMEMIMSRNVTRPITAGTYNQYIDKCLACIGLATQDYVTRCMHQFTTHTHKAKSDVRIKPALGHLCCESVELG